MSEIRPTYTGLITLLTGLVTLVTITISTLIITRTLSQEDYGTWGLIFSLFVYAFMASSFINFWTVRDIARGKEIGKTSVWKVLETELNTNRQILFPYFFHPVP